MSRPMSYHCRSFLSLNTAKYCLSACLLLLIVSTKTFAGSAEPAYSKNIVVTIKPLFSLVAHLTAGIHQPVLLLKNMQTPHHYNMRPSERRLLAKADIIVWLGPQLEPQLSKIIQQRNNQTDSIRTSSDQTGSVQTITISAMQAANLKLLSKRSKHSHEEDHPAAGKYLEANMIDPHIWLSAHNAAQISRHISKDLIIHDPQNARQYEINLLQLLEKIEHTRNSIKTKLNGNRQPYIAFHDAFQYFEDEYKLNYIDSINHGDETGTSPKHLQQVKSHIETKNIQCLVYQPPRPAIINTLTRQTTINATVLDPLGLNVSDDKNAWFELMQQISTNFSACLNP